jgi:hypothetical protein
MVIVSETSPYTVELLAILALVFPTEHVADDSQILADHFSLMFTASFDWRNLQTRETASGGPDS